MWLACRAALTSPSACPTLSSPWLEAPCPGGTLLSVAGGAGNPQSCSITAVSRRDPRELVHWGLASLLSAKAGPERGLKGEEGSRVSHHESSGAARASRSGLGFIYLSGMMLCPARVLHARGLGRTICRAPCAWECCRVAGGCQTGFGSGALSHLIRISLTAQTEANATDGAESNLLL